MTTLIGQKRDPNEPRKGLKRVGFKRKASFKASNKPVKGRPEPKPISDSQKKDNAFMELYRGRPCAVCGTRFWGSANIPTVGHHILSKAVFPEYRHTHENMIPLCAEHHVPFAHGNAGTFEENRPGTFLHWLHDNHPLQWKWAIDHNHHRNATGYSFERSENT